MNFPFSPRNNWSKSHRSAVNVRESGVADQYFVNGTSTELAILMRAARAGSEESGTRPDALYHLHRLLWLVGFFWKGCLSRAHISLVPFLTLFSLFYTSGSDMFSRLFLLSHFHTVLMDVSVLSALLYVTLCFLTSGLMLLFALCCFHPSLFASFHIDDVRHISRASPDTAQTPFRFRGFPNHILKKLYSFQVTCWSKHNF